MANEKCEGYANRDTWLVMLWLRNNLSNYNYICNQVKQRKIEDLNCCELMCKLRRLHYEDKINWHNVNMEEIKQELLDWEVD
ncbi:MAG: hypothetical protein J6T15_05085 [Bacilli bacterium]|nr:hypothetical protein [Bacilli bacterium]